MIVDQIEELYRARGHESYGAVDPEYANSLSHVSRHTLDKQGGPMSPDEQLQFEANPHRRDGLRLRRWEDSQGKLTGHRLVAWSHFRPLLESLATAPEG